MALAAATVAAEATGKPTSGSPAAAASARKLVSPFGQLARKAAATPGKEGCPSGPEPYTAALEFPSKYEGSGRSRDTLNPEAEARYKLATRAMQGFEAGLSELSNRYVQGDSGAGRCAMRWLDEWAQANALSGPANMTGKAVRKWTLSAAAFTLLKVQDAPDVEPAQLQRVRQWLRNVAGIVIQEHSDIPPQKINNHFYWAAAAVGATGIATDDPNLLDWAMEGYRRSVAAIDEEGVLPRELARRSRALSYHLYALQPLVMLAEMGRVNGVDLYSVDDCALCRLVRRVTDGIADPSFFEARTGARQVMEDDADGRALIWVAILSHACPGDTRLQALQARYRPFSGRRLGGNLTDIYEHNSKELPDAIPTQACRHLWR